MDQLSVYTQLPSDPIWPAGGEWMFFFFTGLDPEVAEHKSVYIQHSIKENEGSNWDWLKNGQLDQIEPLVGA